MNRTCLGILTLLLAWGGVVQSSTVPANVDTTDVTEPVTSTLIVTSSTARSSTTHAGTTAPFCSPENVCLIGLDRCTAECGEGYYQSQVTCQTTTVPTTTEPTTTEGSTTPRPPDTPPEEPVEPPPQTPSPPQARRKRQAAADVNSTMETKTTSPPPPRTSSTRPTLPTTLTPYLVCRECNITFCHACADDETQSTICSMCLGGYELNTNKTICQRQQSSSLSGGEIAGIVIGSICLVAIVVVVVVFVLRRNQPCHLPRKSSNLQDVEGPPLPIATQPVPKPKISTEDVQRQHDRVLRYTRDPTFKKPAEEDVDYEEVTRLPQAPDVPNKPERVDDRERYDSPQKIPEAQQSYMDLNEPKEEESDYVNASEVIAQHKKSPLSSQQIPPRTALTNNAPKNQTTPAHKASAHDSTTHNAPKNGRQSPLKEGEELYETVQVMEDNISQASVDSQETYLNKDVIKSLHKKSLDPAQDDTQEIYLNEDISDEQEVYENT